MCPSSSFTVHAMELTSNVSFKCSMCGNVFEHVLALVCEGKHKRTDAFICKKCIKDMGEYYDECFTAVGS